MTYGVIPSSEVLPLVETALNGIYLYRERQEKEAKKEFIKRMTTRKWYFPFALSKDDAETRWEEVREWYRSDINIGGGQMEKELLKIKTLCHLCDEVHISEEHAEYLERPYQRWGLSQ